MRNVRRGRQTSRVTKFEQLQRRVLLAADGIPTVDDLDVPDAEAPIVGASDPMIIECFVGLGPSGEGPDGPIPVESDGGIGDGAGPIPELPPFGDDGGVNVPADEFDFPEDPDDALRPIDLGRPIPVEPDGGIGDGAGPIDLEVGTPLPFEPGAGDPAVVSQPVTESNVEPIVGDTNQDGVVNMSDFLVLAESFGQQVEATFADGDFDGDGDVDFIDFLGLAANFGE